MSEPIHVTDAEFENVVLKSTLPVIVDFWAPWCGPCRMVAPILDKIAKEQDGKWSLRKSTPMKIRNGHQNTACRAYPPCYLLLAEKSSKPRLGRCLKPC